MNCVKRIGSDEDDDGEDEVASAEDPSDTAVSRDVESSTSMSARLISHSSPIDSQQAVSNDLSITSTSTLSENNASSDGNEVINFKYSVIKSVMLYINFTILTSNISCDCNPMHVCIVFTYTLILLVR